MNKEGAMQLSVTAIVILILAIVILGLGLGFIRGMFGKVSTQIEEQIFTEPDPPIATAYNPITLSREKIITAPKEVNVLKVGVYNPTNINWVSEVSDGLVGYWNFDNIVGGVLTDLSGNGNNGMVHGATWVEGKYGAALSFDGSNDYVDVGSLGIPANGVATISGWFYFKDLAKDRGSNMLLYQNFLYQHSANNYFYVTGTNDLFYWKPLLDIWYHLAITYSGDTSTANLYVNGVGYSITQQPGTHNIPSFSGRISGSADAFNGLIDEVLIFNRSLTEEEVQDLHDIGVAPTITCESSSMSGLMSSVNQKIIEQGESTSFSYLIRLQGNVPEGEYLCKVSMMGYQKDFIIEIKT